MVYLKSLMLMFFIYIAGCVGDVKVSKDQVPITAVSVTGLREGQNLNVNYFSITVLDDQNTYKNFEYAIDNEKAYVTGTFNTPITLTVSSEGPHILYIKGNGLNGLLYTATKINFTTRSLSMTGNGRYYGDSLVYYNNYSSMKVSFVTYSGSRVMGDISGKVFMEASEFTASGVSVDNQQPPANVELLLASSSGIDSLRLSGEGYYHSLNMKYLGVDFKNSSIFGDIRLYRKDITTLVITTCSNLHAYNQPGLPDIESRLLLYSFDNRYFYGHVRLVHALTKKVLTYDVKGDAGPGGVSVSGGFPLILSKPFGYILKPTLSPPQTGTGYVMGELDSNGNYDITRFSFNLPGYAIYDSTSDSIKKFQY